MYVWITGITIASLITVIAFREEKDGSPGFCLEQEGRQSTVDTDFD